MRFVQQVDDGISENEAQTWTDEYLKTTAEEDVLAQNWAKEQATSAGKRNQDLYLV